MLTTILTTKERQTKIDETWRWKFALWPTTFEKNDKAERVWLEWYQYRGPYLDRYYRTSSGTEYHYVDSGEY